MSHRAAKRKRHPPDYGGLRKLMQEHRREREKFDLMFFEIQRKMTERQVEQR